MNAHVFLGNPDIVVRPDSVQTARVGLNVADIEAQLNAALYGQVASTVPEQDRMTKIRVRYPDRVRFDHDRPGPAADQPGDRDARHAGAASSAARGRDRLRPARSIASIRTVRSPNELWRENQQPVITVSAELEEARPGFGQPRVASEARRAEVPAGLSLGAGRAATGRSKSRSPAWRWS